MGALLGDFCGRFFDWGFFSADLTFALCAVVLLGTFDRTVGQCARRALDLMALLAADFLAKLALFWVTGRSTSMVIFFLLLVGYALLQQSIRATDKIVRCATFMASFILLTGITGIMAPALGIVEGMQMRWVLPNALSFVALFVIALFLRRFSVSGFRYVPRNYAYLVVAICLIASLAGWCFILFDRSLGIDGIEADATTTLGRLVGGMGLVNLVVDFGFLALVLISYRMFYMLSVEHEQRATRLVARRTASDNAEMIGVTKSVYESMREMRHETKNRVAYMQALLENGQYERLAEYFSSFKGETSSLLDYVQSGNTVVDAVVNAKIALASSRGIEVKTMLAVPSQLSIPEDDLFAVIANLMDNAIEGAAASDVEDKVIKLSIRPEGGYYIVTVQNPCAGIPDGSGQLARLKTTKRDPEVHGYGTKVVSRIARKHDGTATYRVKDDVFTANVMLAKGDE